MGSTPRGVPVECMIDGEVQIYLAGAGTLTFPPDSHRQRDGRPRRLEWLLNPFHVQTLTGPMYNKPRATTFAVAKDLLQEGQQEVLRHEIREAVGETYVTNDRFNTSVAALRKEIVDLRAEIRKASK